VGTSESGCAQDNTRVPVQVSVGRMMLGWVPAIFFGLPVQNDVFIRLYLFICLQDRHCHPIIRFCSRSVFDIFVSDPAGLCAFVQIEPRPQTSRNSHQTHRGLDDATDVDKHNVTPEFVR
jgi:hypothetical protein